MNQNIVARDRESRIVTALKFAAVAFTLVVATGYVELASRPADDCSYRVAVGDAASSRTEWRDVQVES